MWPHIGIQLEKKGLFKTHEKACECHFSRVQLFVTLRLQPTRFLCPWDSPGKNTGVGFHALLAGLFPSQGIKPMSLTFNLHWQAGSLPLEPPGKSRVLSSRNHWSYHAYIIYCNLFQTSFRELVGYNLSVNTYTFVYVY